VSC
jgi:hypothetical protein